MQVLLFLHRLYFFVILNIRNKKTYKMKKIIFLFIISSLISIKGIGLTLSPETEVSILTCAPGNELYSLFGHTAIRINDPRHQIDRVYNYGTFDFSTPHFYLKYARGLLPYQLTVQKFSHFIYNYQLEERTVYAQTIRLDSLEKQRIFDLLEENLLPQNRYYLYNFLFDNCTTRSRDILLKSLPDSVAWNMPDVNKNFWNLLDEYLQASPWVQWGIHTILGQRGNRTATTFQYMFLPDYLMYGLKNARYDGQLLAEPAEVLYQAPEMNLSNSWYGTPLFVFALFHRNCRGFDCILRRFYSTPHHCSKLEYPMGQSAQFICNPFYFQESASSIHQKISEILSGYPGYSYTGLGHCSASRTHGFYLFDYPDDLSVFQTKK